MFKFKKSILFFLILILGNHSFAQKKQVPNLPNYDLEKIHFGFCMGINNLDFHIKKNNTLTQNDSLRSVNAFNEPGLNLSIVSDFSISQYLNLRILPGLGLCSRRLQYNFYSSNDILLSSTNKTINSTLLMLPILLKYKSKRLNNMRGYALLGFEYDYDISSARNLKKQFVNDEVRLNPNQMSASIGYGFDFYTTYFKFSPEIRYGIGINNIQIKDANLFSSSLNGLLTKYWQINFYFE